MSRYTFAQRQAAALVLQIRASTPMPMSHAVQTLLDLEEPPLYTVEPVYKLAFEAFVSITTYDSTPQGLARAFAEAECRVRAGRNFTSRKDHAS
jgi:hypothetical protein